MRRSPSLRINGLVVAQFPNLPLAVWLAATVIAKLTSGTVESVALAIAAVALSAWAYLELSDGANWFRRLLGAAVLIYLVIRLADALPA